MHGNVCFNLVNRSRIYKMKQDFQEKTRFSGLSVPSSPVHRVNLVNPAQDLGVRLNPRVSLSCSSCFTSVRMKREDARERLL